MIKSKFKVSCFSKIIKEEKSSVLGYFKTEYGRYGGVKIIRYLKLLSNGKIKVIDVTRMKTSTISGFGSEPLKLSKSNKKAWDKAKKTIVNNF